MYIADLIEEEKTQKKKQNKQIKKYPTSPTD